MPAKTRTALFTNTLTTAPSRHAALFIVLISTAFTTRGLDSSLSMCRACRLPVHDVSPVACHVFERALVHRRVEEYIDPVPTSMPTLSRCVRSEHPGLPLRGSAHVGLQGEPPGSQVGDGRGAERTLSPSARLPNFGEVGHARRGHREGDEEWKRGRQR